MPASPNCCKLGKFPTITSGPGTSVGFPNQLRSWRSGPAFAVARGLGSFASGEAKSKKNGKTKPASVNFDIVGGFLVTNSYSGSDGLGVGRPRGVGCGRGVEAGVVVAVAVGLGLGVTLGLTVVVGVGVAVGVPAGVPLGVGEGVPQLPETKRSLNVWKPTPSS